MGPGLLGVVVQRGEQVQRLSVVDVRVVVATELHVRHTEHAVGGGLAGGVGEAAGRLQRGALAGRPVAPVPLGVEKGGQHPGQLGGVRLEPGTEGQVGGGEQDRLLDGEPGQRLIEAGEFRDGDAGPGRR